MKRRGALAGLMITLIALTVIASGCFTQDVNADSDNLACVFDGSKTGGHRFKQEVQPGDHIKTSDQDEVVKIPVSNRFYNMTSTENRDTLAPTKLLAYAADNTPVWVEGVLRFRFNTEGVKACEWYSKHGRRNATSSGDLGFNARGAQSQAQAGWFRFLAENFGDTMKQVVHDKSTDWTWEQLVYGNDASVDSSGSPALTEPSVSVAYGVFLGKEFTQYLGANLGGNYFCGIQPALTGEGQDPNCPPIYFQVLNVYPEDASLTAQHAKLQKLQAQLATKKQEAVLNAENRASLIANAKAQREVLEEQIINARLTALANPQMQKCLILAREAKLDCDGHKAPVLVNGQSVGGR